MQYLILQYVLVHVEYTLNAHNYFKQCRSGLDTLPHYQFDPLGCSKKTALGEFLSLDTFEVQVSYFDFSFEPGFL